MNKKIFTLSVFIIFISIVFWNNLYSEDESPTLTSKIYYPLYEYNVTNFCSEFKNNENNSEFVFLTDPSNIYKNLDDEAVLGNFLWDAKELYRNNMDWIYGCATSIINLRALETVKKELWAYKNEQLMAKVYPRIEARIEEVKQEIAESENRCKVNSSTNNNIIKKAILDQSIYEYCKYMFYLQYLKEFTDSRYWMIQYWDSWESGSNTADNVNNIFSDSPESIKSLTEKAIQNSNNVAKEIVDTEKAFPLAFRAYSDYENNLVSHILLELLIDDYTILRQELHKTLNPINQTIYKLINATKK